MTYQTAITRYFNEIHLMFETYVYKPKEVDRFTAIDFFQ